MIQTKNDSKNSELERLYCPVFASAERFDNGHHSSFLLEL